MLFVGLTFIVFWAASLAGDAVLASLGGIMVIDGFLSVALAWGVLKAKPWSRRLGMTQGILTILLGVFFSLLGALLGVFAILLGGWTIYMLRRTLVRSYLHLP
jgi:hypothetical protein